MNIFLIWPKTEQEQHQKQHVDRLTGFALTGYVFYF